MPISPLVLQRRHAELGRIRLGVKVPVGTSGKTRPGKLEKFRFTSPNASLIADIATLYGGTARPWNNAGKPEHEVITDATAIPVIVVKGGFSQWMETWSGGGCVHRCDGERDAITGDYCDPDDRAHRDAKPTTRLSVMLRDVESLGVWRLESHGWNAAAELPMLAELAMHVGDLVPATLHLVERKAIKDGKTSRFVVPVLDLAVSKTRLVEVVSGGAASNTPAINAPEAATGALAASHGGGVAAIEAPRPDYPTLLAAAATVEQCQDLWRAAGEAGHLDDALKEQIVSRANALTPTEPEPETVAGVVVEDPPTIAEHGEDTGDVDASWFALVAAAGRVGLTEPQLREQLEQEYAQPVEDLDAAQLDAFAAKVKGRAA